MKSPDGQGTDDLKLIAFYLPQFYPFEQNSRWWGEGFTEWTNVAQARPLFPGHYQPHIPADLGFYDLRLAETKYDQVALAKEYGVYGFCYHYYWFSGERIMDRPLDEMLTDPNIDMPFCLCWANEQWNKKWNGLEDEVLMDQKLLPDDDVNFIDSLIPFFLDKRYIKVNDSPLLIVYRPELIPDINKTIAIWKERVCINGFKDIYLLSALTGGEVDYEKFGMHGGVEFPPHGAFARSGPEVKLLNEDLTFFDGYKGRIIDFRNTARTFLRKEYPQKNIFKTVYPSWDNTARMRDRGLITLNGTPENYEAWLKKAAALTVRVHPKESQFLFINAWNEWAEGCHLEPDRRFGRGFLEATRRVKMGISNADTFPLVGIPGPSKSSAPPLEATDPKRRHMKFGPRKIIREVNRIVANLTT
ncbi:MAG: glycosyl hydrolase [Hyphomicrobiales bacterium]|nr:glycosyl hydrolase [Hyphomicrobiales bacterium]